MGITNHARNWSMGTKFTLEDGEVVQVLKIKKAKLV